MNKPQKKFQGKIGRILIIFSSVLHYSSTAFSKNGQPTIKAKTTTNDRMGQREGNKIYSGAIKFLDLKKLIFIHKFLRFF